MQVTVHPPTIDGDTVRFAWDQSAPNPFQHENSFFLRYEGIDLSRFSVDLFHEIFLALQLRVFTAYDAPIDLVFSQPVPAPTVAFWTAYHNAHRVTVGPIADVPSYTPWVNTAQPVSTPRSVGVFFGGGKDSMAISCLLTEVKGPDAIVLLQMVHPFRRGDEEMSLRTKRQKTMMINPARRVLGVETQRAWTNYLSQMRDDSSRKLIRPHLELYSVGFLPALLHWGVEVCMPGLGRTAYRIEYRSDGTPIYRYRQSRPEILRAQSRYNQRVLGTKLDVTNLNIMLGPLMSFRLLAERYPAALKQVVMCVSAPVDRRWCYHCTKCVEYAYFSLRCGLVDPRFDYEYFFTHSDYVKQLMTYAESGVELTVHGNAPWAPFMTIAGAYSVFCHAIAHIDPDLLAGRIGPVALSNLLTIKALFGNSVFPNVEMLDAGCVEMIGTDLARAVAAIIGEHFEVVDELPGPIVVGNSVATFDYTHRMTLPSGME